MKRRQFLGLIAGAPMLKIAERTPELRKGTFNRAPMKLPPDGYITSIVALRADGSRVETVYDPPLPVRRGESIDLQIGKRSIDAR